MATFDCIGTFEPIKETEKFKSYSKRTSDSGWTNETFRVNLVSGNNRNLMTITALYKEDMSNNIMAYTRSEFKNGKVTKQGERMNIPFKNRLKTDLSDISPRYLYTIDLNTPNVRQDVHDENIDEDDPKYADNHHVFVSEYDVLQMVKKAIDDGSWEHKKFRVRGNVSNQYSKQNGRFYDSYVPNRIELMYDKAEEYAHATVKLFYGANSIDDTSFDEDGKIIINGWDEYYESNREFKKNLFKPITIVFHSPKKTDKFKENFESLFAASDDRIMQRNVMVNMVNGSSLQEITDDMISAEDLEDIELGLVDRETVIRAMGGAVYGNFVSEWQYIKWTTKPVDSGYTQDMIDNQFVVADDDDEDLFA